MVFKVLWTHDTFHYRKPALTDTLHMHLAITLGGQFEPLRHNLTYPQTGSPLLAFSKADNPGVGLLKKHLKQWKYLFEWFVSVRNLNR